MRLCRGFCVLTAFVCLSAGWWRFFSEKGAAENEGKITIRFS